MKKVLLSVAMGVVAACANAATVEWSMGSVEASPATTSLTTGSMVGFLLESSTLETILGYTTVGDMLTYAYANQFNSSEDTLTVTRGGASASFSVSGITYEGTTNTDGSVSTTYDLYVIIFDGTTSGTTSYYAMTDVATYRFDGITNTLSVTTSFSNTSGWQTVPEPTSGLLMLLGFASIALKRKRL